MKRFTVLLVAAVVAAALFATDAFARGGGGGGRGGGGGGFSGGGARAGGGFSGGARPAASPSMSRAAPSQAMSRPAQYPAASRPAPSGSWQSFGPGQGSAGNRPAQLPARGAAGQRPSQSDVNSFLGLQGGSGAGRSAATTQARPSQLPSNINSGSKTVTGPGGGQVTVGGVGGSRTGPGGGTAAAGRVGVKVTGPGGNTYTKVGGGAAVRGPGGNTVAAGRGASFVNGQFVGGKSWSAVNGNFTHWNYFTPGTIGRYPGAWWPGKWAVAGTAWAAATWAIAGSYCGCSGEGTYYDYGENVAYEDGNVYYGDQPVASAEQYYAEAGQIAESGQAPQDEDWLPLGVFAVISDPAQTQTDKVVQLAVNKEGVIRGNVQDTITDTITPITGAVDKKTQRVAMKVANSETVVVETGLYNLTNDEVPILIHFGPDQREDRTLIRLQQPEEQGQQQQQ